MSGLNDVSALSQAPLLIFFENWDVFLMRSYA
jgi:hypothetical protein